jgi:alkylation response protein AidB-like acyl-CoA dehydrogenase
MERTRTEAQELFRARARAWLEENLPAEERPSDLPGMRAFDCAWQARLFADGWAGISWPGAFGGLGLSAVEEWIWVEEVARSGAPDAGVCFIGLSNVAPVLMRCGNEAQNRQYLGPILRGESVWCQGFSEPDAGSDLASLRTSGVIDGSRMIVNGQKIWTTYGPVADYQQLLVRTDPHSRKHNGITCIICPMDTPGVTVRPIETMAGDANFAEVFYEDAELPLDNVIGAVNEGWAAAMATLGIERSTALTGDVMSLLDSVERLADLARERGESPGRPGEFEQSEAGRAMAQLRAEASALRAASYLGLSRVLHGVGTGAEGSMLRLALGELTQRVTEAAVDLLGIKGLVLSPAARGAGNWSNDYLWARSRTISGGSCDIQRNIIGDRVLGLPRAAPAVLTSRGEGRK